MSPQILSSQRKPELWGGMECTINRVGNYFRDQLADSGHYTREGDIEAFASLGIKKMRYPVLWERHPPGAEGNLNWNETAKNLTALRAHCITPIVGLLHHGSGPPHTDLLDEAFPEKLAAHALEVAKRFPWIEWYTPVNEPLTTARFSGLYGLWYPHHCNEKSFFKMLLNQMKATILCLQAIRTVQPAAKLVQTEDLSKTHSTLLLSYQANYENHRRWLTYDLLCGKVDEAHFFWRMLLKAGISASELRFFLDNKCMPSIIGCNYYVTSERYLDETLAHYPAHTHGGNHTHQYADTEAVRTGHAQGIGFLLKEVWQRYKAGIAVTECHLSCTREEQARWFKETWDACCALSAAGIPIEAVTAWSLTGAHDWNSLLTQQNYLYETGAFEAHHNYLRPTFVARVIGELSKTGACQHPVLQQKGWWNAHEAAAPANASPLLVLGRRGTLGYAITEICKMRRIAVVSLTRAEADICDARQMQTIIEQLKPWAVINATGYVQVDEAELHPAACFAVNANASANVAALCHAQNIGYLSFSSDLVFDGEKASPYIETDTVSPLNKYGASKAESERACMQANPAALIIRTSAFFGPWDRYNFVYDVIQTLQAHKAFYAAEGIVVSPTYVPDLVNLALDLFIDGESGIWHISNDGSITWGDLAKLVASKAGLCEKNLHIQPPHKMGWRALRPRYSALQSEKGVKLPSLQNALDRYLKDRTV